MIPTSKATHEAFMRIALQEAQFALNEGEVPVGAVIVYQGQIIAQDHNRREQRNDPTAHAEVLCLQAAAQKLGTWHLHDCTLYVTLEPCPMCTGALVTSQIGQCIYGAADPKSGCCGSVYDLPADPSFNSRTSWQSGVLASKSETLMNFFFLPKRNH